MTSHNCHASATDLEGAFGGLANHVPAAACCLATMEVLLRTGPAQPRARPRTAAPTHTCPYYVLQTRGCHVTSPLHCEEMCGLGSILDPARRRNFEVLKGVRSRERLPLALSP